MTQKQENAIISVKNIVNKFGKQVVHDGVAFDIFPGEIIGVVGGSGAGKSVLLKTMTGLHDPNQGEISIAGKKLQTINSSEAVKLFGVMFQEGALFSSLTVAENIMAPLKEHSGLKEKSRISLAELKLALVGLPVESGAKYPSQLSGGMIKRAALARALAMDPAILFLDEPTAGLDPINASAFDRLIIDLNQGLGVTVIIVTHDLDTLFTICNRVAVLIDKKVIIDSLPNLLKIDKPWIRDFFHGPRAQGAALAAEKTNGKH